MKAKKKENDVVCEVCGKESHHIHHKDHDNKNNEKENLQDLCTLCHAKEHGIEPKLSELKRLVILRDRLVTIRNMIDNHIRGFSRIEMKVPVFWMTESKRVQIEIKPLEKEIKKNIEENTENPKYFIWIWLEQLSGVSHITASKLISYLDASKFRTTAKMWRYCGLDATHVKRKYKITQEEAKKYGNPYIKKELLGILADNFIKKRTQPYRGIYDKRKVYEIERNPKLTKMHVHRRAIRKMMQIFLNHYWMISRDMQDLPIERDYATEHLPDHSHWIEPPFYKFKQFVNKQNEKKNQKEKVILVEL